MAAEAKCANWSREASNNMKHSSVNDREDRIVDWKRSQVEPRNTTLYLRRPKGGKRSERDEIEKTTRSQRNLIILAT